MMQPNMMNMNGGYDMSWDAQQQMMYQQQQQQQQLMMMQQMQNQQVFLNS